MQAKRIGVLMGGLSPERQVSLETGEAVCQALRSRGYDVVKVLVDRDLDQTLRRTPIDIAFLALHGVYGEDGCVQGLLEMLGIPYTGSGVVASALAMDKLKSKELFRLHNVPTPPYYVLDASQIGEVEEIHGSFGYPVFVKPRGQGSSIGVGRADGLSELRVRCEAAAVFEQQVLVERFIAGREIAVGVLDGKALGAIEIVPDGGVYDYQAKYQSGRSEYHLPARVTSTRYLGLMHLAERACRALDVVGAVRVDMLVTEGENEYVLEVNTLPGMTPTSLLPKIAAGAGYDFPGLCEAILQRAHVMTQRGSMPMVEALSDVSPQSTLTGAQAVS